MAAFFAAEALIYELRPGHAEGWVRVSLERGPEPRIVIEGHNYRYRLAPTAFVLEGITSAVRRIEPEAILTGRAVLGPVGVQALERLSDGRQSA